MSFKSTYIKKIKKMNKERGYCNSCKHPIELGEECYGIKKSDGFIIKNVGYSCKNCINEFK